MNYFSRGAGTIVLAGVLAAMAALPAAAVEPDAPDALIAFEETVGMDVVKRLNNPAKRLGPDNKADREGLAAYYTARGSQPVWVTRNGLNQRALDAIAEISKADDWGLPAGDFELPKMAVGTDNGPVLSRDVLAEAELTLSLAVLKYARYARGGRADPLKMTKFFDRVTPVLEPQIAMARVAEAGDVAAGLRDLNPKHPQFEALRQRYLALRKGVAKKNPALPKLPDGPSLKKGMKHSHVAILRDRLGVATAEGTDAKLFDAAVDEAVNKFQREAGLDTDGVVGPGTRSALNGNGAKGSPEKLLVNMEQWRWMPEDMGKLHVWVNIPEFKVRLVRDGKVIHTERVVVGKPTNQTPVFSDKLEWLEFHPSWYVPTSIKVNEIGPSLRRRGSSYLSSQNLEVTCPNGGTVHRQSEPAPSFFSFSAPKPKPRADIRNCAVRQPPGPTNVLGVVKFKLPNKHDVYLHDTSSKSLFNKQVRAYSHGCVRVRNPIKLAELILGIDQGMSSKTIQAIVDGPRQTKETHLKTKVPVHFTYFTALADDAGKLTYFQDLYGHEKRIALGVQGKYDQIAPVPVPKAPTRVASSPASSSSDSKPKKDWIQNIFGF